MFCYEQIVKIYFFKVILDNAIKHVAKKTHSNVIPTPKIVKTNEFIKAYAEIGISYLLIQIC